MRFSLRTLMIICLLITVTFGWLGSQYIKWKREQQLLADLHRPLDVDLFTGVRASDEKFERYSLDRLSKIAETYSELAQRKSSDSVAARIAAGALIHLGGRYDGQSNECLQDPRAKKIAEGVFDSKIEPLASASTMILMLQHRLSDDIHASQSLPDLLEDGYDSDNPLDVYVLVTEIYSEFQYCSAEYSIEENWPSPKHPWDFHSMEPPSQPSHSYEDKIDALRQVSPEAADAYAAIVEELRKCDAKPSDALRVTLAGHADDMMSALKTTTIFQFMLKNVEVFNSQPELRFPQLNQPQTPSAED